MKIRELIDYLEEIAPLNYAEDFDNVGLLVGNKNTKLTGVLVTLDTLENTIDEAITNHCNLVVSFHPIIFSGLKKINGNNYVERVVLKAIKNDIAIYAIHTALDNSRIGVNAKICEVLGIENTKILIPQKNTLYKLVTFVPKNSAGKVRNSLFNAGAGNIGNYDQCSFNFEGKGTYRANEEANPALGKIGEIHTEKETQISVIFEKHQQNKIIKALIESHPYEEVAYDIIPLANKNKYIGIGMVGELKNTMSEKEFLSFVKKTMKVGCIKHSKFLDKPIKKVAVLGGSGSFAIKNAIKANADVYLTADLKYHDFFKAENNILLADIGHYESEQYTKNLIVSLLTKKFPNFAVVLSNINTNPIYYF